MSLQLEYLKLQLVLLIRMLPVDVPRSSTLIMLPPKCENSQQEFKTLNPTHLPSRQTIKSRNDEAWVGAPEERNHAHAPIVQPSTIKH